MCLYPRLIKNRKYTATKKNGGCVPYLDDLRKSFVPIGCGNCIECRKQKAREWQVRLNEEIKSNQKKAYFLTLTFSNESLEKLMKSKHSKECNAIATIAVRRFLERARKKYKKSLQHWLITELGHEGTERIHLHGIIWTDNPEDLEALWSYGNIWIGEYCNAKTINYIIKYVTKIDEDHKNYKSVILCSKGIGRQYCESKTNQIRHAYAGERTNETYKLNNGAEINMPIYYRNKFYSEEEREKLWTQMLDKKEMYIMGIKIDISTKKGRQLYADTLEYQQKLNRDLGYGGLSKEWQKETYNVTLKMLNKDKDF